MALNLAADRARRARRRLAALRRLGPPAPTPAVQVQDLALLEALRGLSIGQRQVLVLHYPVGMPVQEVARPLGAKRHPSRSAWPVAVVPWPGTRRQQEVRPRHD